MLNHATHFSEVLVSGLQYVMCSFTNVVNTNCLSNFFIDKHFQERSQKYPQRDDYSLVENICSLIKNALVDTVLCYMKDKHAICELEISTINMIQQP